MYDSLSVQELLRFILSQQWYTEKPTDVECLYYCFLRLQLQCFDILKTCTLLVAVRHCVKSLTESGHRKLNYIFTFCLVCCDGKDQLRTHNILTFTVCLSLWRWYYREIQTLCGTAFIQGDWWLRLFISNRVKAVKWSRGKVWLCPSTI